ncbi:hypothetical protein [Mesorhizobium onobrychidis]|uniref:Uncharacterized protein n=1 Tax=Mesorhizobium onobrychidis TaxID=2775404 RepID=A0ABY5QSB2_9HYPH|nr:hypothetical protein [Mesorhizobium onobrychidis]UVC13124.1 hypothetical protein IHQ72_20485 [Mesorhizobium onobrychidis]
MTDPIIDLVETAIIPDVFISGMADMENLGDGNFRCIFYSRQRAIYERGKFEHVIVCRLVMSAGAAHAMLKQIAHAVERRSDNTDSIGFPGGALQ